MIPSSSCPPWRSLIDPAPPEITTAAPLLHHSPGHDSQPTTWRSTGSSICGKQVPTLAHAARANEKTIERILKVYRIRRLDANTALRLLRTRALTVAPGTTEAACVYILTLAARARLINAQLKQAQRRLD